MIERRGSCLAFGTRQLGQGTMAAIEYLKENAQTLEEIVEEVKKASLLPTCAVKQKKSA